MTLYSPIHMFTLLFAALLEHKRATRSAADCRQKRPSSKRPKYLFQGTHCTGKTRKMTPKNPVREFANFAKTRGIWFAQVVNSLILKLKDVSDICCKNFQLIFKAGLPSKFCVCNSHKSLKLSQGKFVVGQGKDMKFGNVI